MNPDYQKAARELLAFYQEAGVDALLGEEPVDRFADPAQTSPAAVVQSTPQNASDAMSTASDRPTDGSDDARRTLEFPTLTRKSEAPPRPTTPGAPLLSPEAVATSAREAAKSAQSLEELRAILGRFEGCALRNTATQLVFAAGNPKARVMFVGEAPGRDEDLEGLPFVGRSGKLLDLMMAAIGLDRSSAYISNIIPWRPPGNRDPTPQESLICLPFIKRQIELADPDILVCLGKPSAQTLLDINDGILKARGRWFKYHTGTREIRATVTLHPAYLLRQPVQKRLVWRDFLAIKKALAATGETKS